LDLFTQTKDSAVLSPLTFATAAKYQSVLFEETEILVYMSL